MSDGHSAQPAAPITHPYLDVVYPADLPRYMPEDHQNYIAYSATRPGQLCATCQQVLVRDAPRSVDVEIALTGGTPILRTVRPRIHHRSCHPSPLLDFSRPSSLGMRTAVWLLTLSTPRGLAPCFAWTFLDRMVFQREGSPATLSTAGALLEGAGFSPVSNNPDAWMATPVTNGWARLRKGSLEAAPFHGIVVGSVDFSTDSAADAQLLTWMQVTKTVLSVYGERMAMAPGGALVSTEGKPLSLWAGHLRLR